MPETFDEGRQESCPAGAEVIPGTAPWTEDDVMASTRTPRRILPVLLALATSLALVAVLVPASQAQGVPVCRPGGEVLTGGAPGSTDSPLTHVCNIPDTAMISAEFAETGNFLYASSTDTLSVYSYEMVDGAPTNWLLESAVPIVNFENESMTYGERRDAGGAITDRFVIMAEDTVSAHPEGAHTGGHNVVIVDVTDPTDAHVRSTGEIPTSTHTVQCVSRLQCDYAYAVGEDGVFTIIDLTDLDDPKPVEGKEAVPSPAAGPNAVFTSGAGHDWWFDEAGVGWHTGSGGIAAFDVTDPLNPRLLNEGDESSITSPLNDFILHNAKRPFASAYDDDRAANEPEPRQGQRGPGHRGGLPQRRRRGLLQQRRAVRDLVRAQPRRLRRAVRRRRRRARDRFDPHPRRDQPAAGAGPARWRLLLGPLVRRPRDRDRRRGLLPGWAAPDRRARPHRPEGLRVRVRRGVGGLGRVLDPRTRR